MITIKVTNSNPVPWLTALAYKFHVWLIILMSYHEVPLSETPVAMKTLALASFRNYWGPYFFNKNTKYTLFYKSKKKMRVQSLWNCLGNLMKISLSRGLSGWVE